MSMRTRPRDPMAWQSSLAELLKSGARLARFCSRCETWEPVDVLALAVARGEDASLWDKPDPCPRCGGHRWYSASPAKGTPFMPLRSGG